MSSERFETDEQGYPGRAGGLQLTVVSWASSLTLLDGGGQRVRAFRDSLEHAGVQITTLPVGLSEEQMSTVTTESALHDFKRKYFPVPFRRPIVRELSRASNSNPVISLMSGSHSWAIEQSAEAWIDFPDLWSDYARVAASSRALVPSTFNRCQASLWRRREIWEAKHAKVTTTASYADARTLGSTAYWLPNPVYSKESNYVPRKLGVNQSPVFGMLANFDYPPNRSAYAMLVREWLPVLRSENVKLVVAGFSANTLPPAPGVENWGSLSSINEFYDEVDFALAPMTEGGGMKVKVVEALARGIPVIATDAAVSGLPPAIAGSVMRWSELTGNWLTNIADVDALRSKEARAELECFSQQYFNSMMNTLLEKFAG